MDHVSLGRFVRCLHQLWHQLLDLPLVSSGNRLPELLDEAMERLFALQVSPTMS